MRKVFKIASFASLLVIMVAIGFAAVSTNRTVAQGEAPEGIVLSTIDSVEGMESTVSPGLEGENMSMQAPNAGLARGVCTLSCTPCFSNANCPIGESCQRLCF